ncbi:MAG: DUF2199 domain-containing protein [Myxococcales bacterium]|nr:DUF2199 domain-containing protein [Myxococcales bacterium]
MKHCDRCGDNVAGIRDIAFPMPYDIAALSASERKKRAKTSSDLCSLDDRFFIRGVATVPILGSDETLRWGVWAEVSEPLFKRYLLIYRDNASGEPPVAGAMANDLRGYPPTRGHDLTIRFGTATERPQLILAKSENLLSREQHGGIDHARLHEILALNGLDSTGEDADAAPEGPRLMRCSQSHPEDWPFAEPPTIATFTTRQVMEGATILFAKHEDNGEWTILDREDWTQDDLVAVCLSHVVEREPKLAKLADLPLGWAAQRSGARKKWTRWQHSEE